jgi:hypothetical protein
MVVILQILVQTKKSPKKILFRHSPTLLIFSPFSSQQNKQKAGNKAKHHHPHQNPLSKAIDFQQNK